LSITSQYTNRIFTDKLEKWALALLSLVVLGVIAYLSHLSPGLEGGMDSYNHYLIARYTWEYPYLFLDQWGKPLYNLLASPFVQFGINGAIVLNCVSLIGCSILVYRILLKIGINNAWLGYILTLLSPIFLDNTISSLTEPLCALLVLLTLYFYIDKRYVLSAVMAGFLPFARSEGFIILFVVFVFIVIIQREYKAILYTAVGSILFNLLGWYIEGEPLWIFTSNPYIKFEMSGINICGRGDIYHYFRAGHYTFGKIASWLLVVGAIVYVIRWLRVSRIADHAIGIILCSFTLYFASHAAIWWLGKMGSCGYVRVMVVIAPLASIIMTYGLHHLFLQLEQKLGDKLVLIQRGFMLFVLLNAIYTPYRYYAYKYPMQVSAEQQEYHKLVDWMKSQPLDDRRKIYLYPYFSMIADINPYNQEEHYDFWASSLQFAEDGDILIWDGHFGPHESGTPLLSLEQDSTWKKIHAIVPKEKIVTLNDKAFEIHVFEKIK
jgi:hypothetical protein